MDFIVYGLYTFIILQSDVYNKVTAMPKIVAPLTIKQVNAITKDGFTALGGTPGLYILVRGVSRSWVYRYTSPETGKPTMKSLGTCSSMTLLAARQVANDLWMKVRSGVDPVKEAQRDKQRRKESIALDQKSQATFKTACEEWIQSRLDSGYYSDPEQSVKRVRQILNNHLYPAFADKPMSVLSATDLFEFLKPFHKNHPGTWRKVRAIMNGVCRWAVAMGYCTQNVSDTRGALGVFIENLGGSPPELRNRGALDYSQVPDFFAKLIKKNTVVAKQFAFALLTAARSKQVRMLTWDQIDFEKRTWTCPEESMKVKGRGDFVTFLSDAAIALLRSMPKRKDTDYVFATPYGKPFSDVAMRKLILQLNSEAVERGEPPLLDEEQTAKFGKPVLMTQHGTCRACFKTWSKSDGRAFNTDAVELCLAHQIDYRFGGAYDRAKLEAERREVLEAWAKFCTSKCPELSPGK